MVFRRVKPWTEMFVRWFKDKEDYMEYYWVKKNTLIQDVWAGDVVCVYTRMKARNKRWRAWKRTYIKTFDFLKFLNFKRVLTYDEYKKYKKRKKKDDDFWMVQTAHFSEAVRKELTSKLLKEVILIVSRIGIRKDRYISEGFIKFLNPNDQQQVNDYEKQVKRSPWRPRTLNKDKA